MIVNVQKIQSDALILHEGQISHVRLPTLVLAKVEKWHKDWQEGLEDVSTLRFPIWTRSIATQI